MHRLTWHFSTDLIVQDFTAFDLDEFVAGKSKAWTFWNCEPSTFPWEYGSVETAYILQGKFSVQYEGADPVTLVAGDFVSVLCVELSGTLLCWCMPVCHCRQAIMYSQLCTATTQAMPCTMPQSM